MISFALLGIYSAQLPTNNSEEIYLTKSRIKEERSFNQKYEVKDYLAVLGEAPTELSSICEELSCEYVTHHQIQPDSKSKFTIISSTSKKNLQKLVSYLPKNLVLSGSVVINNKLNQKVSSLEGLFFHYFLDLSLLSSLL